MVDSILERARLAIAESADLREQRAVLRDQHDRRRRELRRAIFESASARVEADAIRQDRK